MSELLRLESTASQQEATRFVEQMSGQALRECYQCAKCAAGCPLARAVDLSPQQVLRALQLGQADIALDSKALWLCVGCQTCATRCPCEVDVPRVMDALRAWALANGRPAAQREVTTFHKVFLKTVEMTGRVYEVGLIGGYNLLSGHLFDSLDLGWPMVRRGKIRPLPARVQARAEVAAIFERAEKVRARERNAAHEAARGATV
jgi:heterodisulfide reductase subunit C